MLVSTVHDKNSLPIALFLNLCSTTSNALFCLCSRCYSLFVSVQHRGLKPDNGFVISGPLNVQQLVLLAAMRNTHNAAQSKQGMQVTQNELKVQTVSFVLHELMEVWAFMNEKNVTKKMFVFH